MMNIFCHGRAFDEMDDEIEASYSHEDFCQPIKCALNEEPSNARSCISIESDLSIDLLSSCLVKDGYSDIFDDYDIFYPTIIGTGNYGCVRECLRRSTGQKYAVKTIEKSKVTRRDHIQREIQLLRSIDHPGIMKMVDCYEDDDYVHIVTEMYTGGELFDKIVNNTTDSGCLPEDQAAKIIKSLLEAVQYLHSKDIVHRDIKPANILFESNEEGSSVKLIDFGLKIVDNTTDSGCLPEDQAAKIIKSLLEAVQYLHNNDIVHRDIKPENVLFESNEEGSSVKLIDFGLSRTHGINESAMTNQVGTLYYMSPGVLQGKYDRSCDLWSIGIVSYILLCGYPPFNGSSDYEIHDAIRRGHLVFEEDVWGNLSNASRDFVSKLLCMDSSKIGTVP
eukprot:CAMPEP_0201946586 /NCGR_PEP_ID=MMETSP0903-20130614/54496_1 /ASSEMBLY_ACC=CAM_ASM_000552 /TAXON_ID=420261 /ORGANISM="Thalassiosira antarctica, Strain CCMP982" /LENGTH=390 /DNA_ID=CAMNT_0048489689 /DNA_START=295 /DNA_END=1462 /DNA_ORIENTATION=-